MNELSLSAINESSPYHVLKSEECASYRFFTETGVHYAVDFIPDDLITEGESYQLITAHAMELKQKFGIRSLCLFGSVSRDEQRDDSDVDVCVEMEASAYMLVRLKRFLESLLGCSVDVVRMHKHINPYLLKEIENDGIYVIQ